MNRRRRRINSGGSANRGSSRFDGGASGGGSGFGRDRVGLHCTEDGDDEDKVEEEAVEHRAKT